MTVGGVVEEFIGPAIAWTINVISGEETGVGGETTTGGCAGTIGIVGDTLADNVIIEFTIEFPTGNDSNWVGS